MQKFAATTAQGEKDRREGTNVAQPPDGDQPFDIEFEVPPAVRSSPKRKAEATATGGPDAHLVSLVAPTSFEAEQYRMLRHTVEQTGRTLLAVTSAGSGDGKTTTAINLAAALAQAAEARVLLVEADLRRPSFVQRLGMDARGPSLVRVLLHKGGFPTEAVRVPRRPNLAVLPAGPPPLAPYELLKSPRLGELLAEARGHYDYIVVDTPPVLTCPDYRLLEQWIDGVLLVVGAHHTPRKMVDAAMALLDRAKIVGLVFNGDDSPEARYHYSSHIRDRTKRRR